jgi:hypothetical protein
MIVRILFYLNEENWILHLVTVIRCPRISEIFLCLHLLVTARFSVCCLVLREFLHGRPQFSLDLGFHFARRSILAAGVFVLRTRARRLRSDFHHCKIFFCCWPPRQSFLHQFSIHTARIDPSPCLSPAHEHSPPCQRFLPPGFLRRFSHALVCCCWDRFPRRSPHELGSRADSHAPISFFPLLIFFSG